MKYFIYWQTINNKLPQYITDCINNMKSIFGESLIIIDNNNLVKYIPILPKFFHRIPKIAIKVDYIRIALLYYHGGCYLDADTIIFPKFLDDMNNLPNADLIGVGKNNDITGNAILIAPNAKSLICKKILEKQEEIIQNKKGILQWSDIGGNLISDICKSCKSENTINVATFTKNPIYFSGWKNSLVFLSKDDKIIIDFIEKIKIGNYGGVVLYNQIMKKYIPNQIPKKSLLWYLLKKN